MSLEGEEEGGRGKGKVEGLRLRENLESGWREERREEERVGVGRWWGSTGSS